LASESCLEVIEGFVWVCFIGLFGLLNATSHWY
jgi:hypothetical protein